MKINIKKQLNIAIIFALLSLPLIPVFAAEVTKEEVVNLTNQEREKEGLPSLIESDVLDKAALLKAQDMIGNNYFAHTSPKGTDPWYWFEQADYPYKYAGENLAMDFTSGPSVMRAWMKSPTHKENILSSKYKETGVAVMDGIIEEKETKVAVQLFGTKLSDQVETLVLKTEQGNTPSLKIEEATAKPWAETGEDEVLVYVKITGEAKKVEAILGERPFEMLRHDDGVYMGLFSLKGIDLNQNSVIIKAEDEKGGNISYQIPKEQYFGYFEKKDQMIQQETDSNKAAEKEIQENYVWKNFIKQNLFLAVALVLFLIMIGNVWILEREEQQLLDNLRAV
jgi:hypothetical protein